MSNRVDDLILEVINASGQIDDTRLVTEAMVIYASVKADAPGTTGYGRIFYNDGNVPHHHVVGLLDTVRDQICDEAEEGDD